MKGNRIVIPVSMRLDVLDKIHEAHQGIAKCRERAKASVWWPGLSKFAEEYGFTHITTSPRYPQANGQVERAVQTVKNMLKKATDPYQALMAYRATPLESGISPAELLMGRKIRTKVPTLPTLLDPSWPYLERFREKDASLKARQKENFDKRHSAKVLPHIPPGERVWLPDQKVEGTVVANAGTPRSYTVKTPSGHLRRNRRHLNLLPGTPKADSDPGGPDTSSTPPVGEKTNTPAHPPTPVPSRTTRCGREIRLPERFRDK